MPNALLPSRCIPFVTVHRHGNLGTLKKHNAVRRLVGIQRVTRVAQIGPNSDPTVSPTRRRSHAVDLKQGSIVPTLLKVRSNVA